MIVKCEQCQTKFKIPDDKVTDKGVKVRCTKCGNTFRVTREPAAAAPAPEADPFARFGGPPAEPPKAPPAPRAGAFSFDPPAPLSSPPSPPAAAAPAPFDFGSLAPPPAAPAASAAPFDFSALVPSTAPAPAAPASSNLAGPAFDFSSLGAAAPPPAEPPRPKPQPAPAAKETPAFDFSSLSTGSSPSPAPFKAPPAPPAPTSVLPDLPALDLSAPSPRPMSSVRFDGADANDALAPRPSPSSQQAARDALFDMSAALPPPAPEAPVEAPLEAPPPIAEAAAPPAPPKPLLAPEEATRSQRRRTAVGLVVNVAIAGVLVLVLAVVGSALLNEGTVDAKAFSGERLKALVSNSAEFVAADISNGLYETTSGRPVFFVRGEVLSRAPRAARAVVKVELLAGDTVVRSGECLASAPPSPEELFALAAPDALDALLARQAKRATELAPGAKAPFVMPFFEYPPDLKSFRVRVSVRGEAAGTAAR